jgi:BirA family biotin operon repressor/biotin-[acetyl-CoA-carboxylase] ligase
VGTIGREIIRFDHIDSTMDEIERLARVGTPEGVVVVAGYQEQGRGRSGRRWTALPDMALLCSILLRPHLSPEQLGPLPLVVGVAVAEAIEAVSGLTCALKWPNDILIDGGKAAGILIQTRLTGGHVGHVNLGIGINLAGGTKLPEGATSLATHGANIGRDELLNALLDRLNERYRAFVSMWSSSAVSSENWLDDWRRRAALLGETVGVVLDGTVVQGRFADVDPLGRMQLKTDAGEIVSLSYGEIERGPRRS